MDRISIPCNIPDNEFVIAKIGIVICKVGGHHKGYMPWERNMMIPDRDHRFINRVIRIVEKSLSGIERKPDRKAKAKAKAKGSRK